MAELLTSTRSVPLIDPQVDFNFLSNWSTGTMGSDTADHIGCNAGLVPETTSLPGPGVDSSSWMRLVCLVKKKQSLAEDRVSQPLFEEHEIKRWLQELAPTLPSTIFERYWPAPVKVLRERPLTVLDPYADLLSQFEP